MTRGQLTVLAEEAVRGPSVLEAVRVEDGDDDYGEGAQPGWVGEEGRDEVEGGRCCDPLGGREGRDRLEKVGRLRGCFCDRLTSRP